MCRLLVRDAAGENESSLLTETVPSWVSEIVVEKTIPKFIKIPFYLLPHPQMVKQDRMKKVHTKSPSECCSHKRINSNSITKHIFRFYVSLTLFCVGSLGGQ